MQMTSSSLNIHRLLDEAFTGVEMTPEAQDLKEEMRGNLVARVSELEVTGVAPEEAARRAIAELGDIRSVVREWGDQVGEATPPWRANRVRPRPGYVIRTLLLSLAALSAVATALLLAWGAWSGQHPSVDMGAAIALAALVGGGIVGDALRQETTTNYPVTRARAIGYTGASSMGIAALGAGLGYWWSGDLPWLVVGATLLLAAIVAFTYLGVTQTNRHKPWVVREQRRHEAAGDRFERDPAAGARFGIYTVAIGMLTAAVAVVLGLTVGWVWVWLPLVVGGAVWFLILANMLFGHGEGSGSDRPHAATVRS